MKAPSAVAGFMLRTLGWLPLCFAAWSMAAPYHAIVAGKLSRGLVGVVAPGMVEAVERAGPVLVFVTTVEVRAAPGQSGALVAEVNPLLYTYGLALLLALMLAARARWRGLLAGAALLLPFQAAGIAFDFLSQVAITLGPEVAARSGIVGWRVEAIALGYQAGALLMPALAPVMLWAMLCRDFVEQHLLVRRAATVRPRTDGRSRSGHRGEVPQLEEERP